jgi:hypothetical protein
MANGPSRLLALAFLIAGIGPGCGGDPEERTVTVTEKSTATGERDAAGEKKDSKPKPRAEPPTLAEQAEAVVERYYAAVDSSLYEEAWKLLAPPLQAEQGGFAAWKAGYSTTLETKAVGVQSVSANPETATVELEIRAVDSDACGTVDQTFTGTWTLGRFDGGYLGTAFNVAKVGGGTPMTDPAACTGGGTAPVSSAGCDPNYTGCVPPYPPDVDCIDLREEVEVVGEDVHHLDLGGDEEACEVFFK